MNLDPLQSVQWMEFVNNNAAQVPAFGCMRISGTSTIEQGRVILTCERPDTYGAQYWHVLNGPIAVDNELKGICTRSGIMVGLYDDADGTPVFGQIWGPRSGGYKLKLNTPGFFCLGAPTNTTDFLALFTTRPFLRFRGVADADIAADATGTVSIYYRSGATAYTDTTVNATALNDLDDTVPSGASVECVYDPYPGGAGAYTESWRIIQSDFSC